MINNPKTLVIVEGGHLEPVFFNQLKNVFSLNLDIYCLKNNIYLLYRKMRDMGFNGDIRDVLSEICTTDEEREVLSQKFAYTYLIFDFDPQHTEEYEKNDPLETIVNRNISKVKEMASYFIDETDPTIGKLYINYPMMEAFKDCDSFDDDDYLSRMIELKDIKQYKSIVGTRKMANKRVDKYTINDYSQLARQNVRKAGKMFPDFNDPISYEWYIKYLSQINILLRETEYIRLLNKLSVLNTSSFFALDYYGNKDGAFDKIMQSKHINCAAVKEDVVSSRLSSGSTKHDPSLAI